jgi:hypothetical protein
VNNANRKHAREGIGERIRRKTGRDAYATDDDPELGVLRMDERRDDGPDHRNGQGENPDHQPEHFRFNGKSLKILVKIEEYRDVYVRSGENDV